MEIFEQCQKINDLLTEYKEHDARNELIKLLNYHSENDLLYSPLVNHLVRATGLYPYLQPATSSWQDQYVNEVFKVNVGGKLTTLHREQSSLLKSLLSGESVAVSAPTSFGKSFVIDAFISIKKPKNVVIIVPTIALTDETRRRLYKKFSNEYKIITTTDSYLAEKNIFIFPQERAINYVNKIKSIDILVIDEFYKASSTFDKERSPALLKAIIKLGFISMQKYYLAPNITEIKENIFTQGMKFENKLNFNTIFLEKHEVFKDINNKNTTKSDALLNILSDNNSKSLIYAGTYAEIEKVSNLIIDSYSDNKKELLTSFSNWLTKNYEANWKLTNLIKRSAGIHNGRLHRSLGQIQIKLFEEPNGLNTLISTSSIIEGVNTSAENVIIWRNRNGASKLNDFTYKNIIGRGGRMFKHFIGKVYLLEEPPENITTQLDIPFPDSILGDIDEVIYGNMLNQAQIEKINLFREELLTLLGEACYVRLWTKNTFKMSDTDFIKNIAYNITFNRDEWEGIAALNSNNSDSWDRILYRILELRPGKWEIGYSKYIAFIKIISKMNWINTIPDVLKELGNHGIGIDLFFNLERNTTFQFASLLSDVNELQKEILENGVDISPFISKISHAFLPSVVYQLEEYGLPRIISRKIHESGIIDFTQQDLTIHETINIFIAIGKEKLLSMNIFDDFDKYIILHFYDGITFEVI